MDKYTKEISKLSCTKLMEEIRKNVKGYIYAHVQEDETLFIEIKKDDVDFCYYMKDYIHFKTFKNLTCEEIAKDILRNYRAFIMSKYFH